MYWTLHAVHCMAMVMTGLGPMDFAVPEATECQDTDLIVLSQDERLLLQSRSISSTADRLNSKWCKLTLSHLLGQLNGVCGIITYKL
jgi:hypothetical protein